MLKEIYICDRCKKEIDINDWGNYGYHIIGKEDKQLDLCNKCSKDLKVFMEGVTKKLEKPQFRKEINNEHL